jgi:hypothetical protein
MRSASQFILLLVICSSCLLQSRARRAERFIEKEKYQNAYTLLHRGLHKDSANVANPYLLSKLLLDTAWRQDIDSAHFFIKESQRLFTKADARQRKKLEKLPLDSALLAQQVSLVDSAAYGRAKHQNTVVAFQYFINNYPDAQEIPLAVSLRNSLAFTEASRVNTWQTYQDFYQTYPKAEQAFEAKELYEQLLFEERTQTGTLEAYRSFLQEQPRTPYRDRLLRNIYFLSTADNSEQAYSAYIQEFGLNIYGRQALTHILYMKDWPAIEWQNLPLPDSLRPILSAFDQHNLPIYTNNNWQFITEEGWPWPGAYADVHPDYLCESPKQLWLEIWTGQKSAIVAVNGTTIYSGEYEKIEDVGGGLLKIMRHGLWGLFIVNGNQLLPFKFKNITRLDNGLLRTEQNNKQGLLAANGQELFPPQTNKITTLGQAIVLTNTDQQKAITSLNHLINLQQANQEWEPVFNYLQLYSPLESIIVGQSADSLWSVLSAYTLKPVIQRLPSSPAFHSSTELIVKEDNGNRVLVLGHNEQASPRYRQAQSKNGWLLLQDSTGWIAQKQFVTTKKPHYYDSVAALHKNVLWTRTGTSDSVHIFFKENKRSLSLKPQTSVRIIRPGQIPDSLRDQDPYIVVLEYNNESRVLTSDGTEIGRFKQAQLSSPTVNLILVKTKQSTNLYNYSGELVSKKKFEAAGNFQDGNLALLNNKKFGVYNPVKNWLIEPRYDAIPRPLGDSLFAVSSQGQWGVINYKADYLLKPKFQQIEYWNDSLLLTQSTDDYWQIRNVKLDSQLADSLENLKWYGTKFLQVDYKGQRGVLSKTSGWVVPPRFKIIENLGSTENPIFYCELEQENNTFLVAYYNFIGKKLFEEVYTEQEWLKLICE